MPLKLISRASQAEKKNGPDQGTQAGKGGKVVQLPQPLTPLEKTFLPATIEIEETPPSPAPRVVLWVIVSLITTFIIWTCVAQVDVVSTTYGKVVPDGGIKAIQATDNAIIRAIHIKEGQFVKRGDLLIELDPSINSVDLGSGSEKLVVTRVELARLNAELTGQKPDYAIEGARQDMILQQETLRLAREGNFNARLAEAKNNQNGKEMFLYSSMDNLRKLQETAKSVRDKEARVRPFVGQVMSHFDYLKLKDDLTQIESDIAAQQNLVRQIQADKSALEQKTLQIKQEQRSQIMAEVREKLSLITAQQGDVDKNTKLVSQKELRAPVDGQVQSLNVTTVGGVVVAAQTLATVVPKDSPLVIETSLSNEDIGFVRVGQPVDIKVDTFPFQKFGTIKGTVTWVSPDADMGAVRNSDTGQNATDSTAKQKLSYRMRIQPGTSSVSVYGKPQLISPGMTVEADVITDKRTIIEFFLAPVVKYWKEGMQVR